MKEPPSRRTVDPYSLQLYILIELTLGTTLNNVQELVGRDQPAVLIFELPNGQKRETFIEATLRVSKGSLPPEKSN